MLKVGDKAPNFQLPTHDERTVTLNDLKGNWVVVYFYPKDMTSGCTKQAIAFSENLTEFAKQDAIIIGISPDDATLHDKFVSKHNLKIILASDESKQVIESYGVWKEKKMYGNTYMGVERTTFLVDRDGIINEIWSKVKVKDHEQKVLNHLAQQNKLKS